MSGWPLGGVFLLNVAVHLPRSRITANSEQAQTGTRYKAQRHSVGAWRLVCAGSGIFFTNHKWKPAVISYLKHPGCFLSKLHQRHGHLWQVCPVRVIQSSSTALRMCHGEGSVVRERDRHEKASTVIVLVINLHTHSY